MERRVLLYGDLPEWVRDINLSPPSVSVTEFAVVGSHLFLVVQDESSGTELWKSDGTSAGTVRVADLWPGSGDSTPDRLTNVNGTLFFAAEDGVSGRELWKSDGTEAGTVRARDIRPGSSSSSPRNLTNVNGTLFFFG